MAFISVFPGFTAEAGFSLTGNIGDGNSVTITGSGFGTKPHGAKPWLFFELGKGVATADSLSRGTYSGSWKGATAQTVVAPNRTHSREKVLDGIELKFANDFVMESGSTKTDMYMFNRFHINADGADMYSGDINYNLKMNRYSAGGGLNDVLAILYGQFDGVSGNPRISASNTGTGTNFIGGDGAIFGLRKNEWITEEWELHQGAVDVEEATLKISRNGVVNSEGPDGVSPWVSRTTGFPNLYNLMVFLNDQQQGDPGFTMYIRCDFYLVDDSRCHIIISDEPTWEAATASPEVLYEREPQISTAWADDEVIFTMRRGVHSSFAGKRLYVTDSAGTTQKILQFN